MSGIDRAPDVYNALLESLWEVHRDSASIMSRERVYKMGHRHGFAAAKDEHNGTPCAEIRWQHERDELKAALAAAEAREAKLREALRNIGATFPRLPSGLTDFGERHHYLHLACRLRDHARAALTDKGDTDNDG